VAAVRAICFGGFAQELFDALELVPRDVAWMGIGNESMPVLLGHGLGQADNFVLLLFHRRLIDSGECFVASW